MIKGKKIVYIYRLFKNRSFFIRFCKAFKTTKIVSPTESALDEKR